MKKFFTAIIFSLTSAIAMAQALPQLKIATGKVGKGYSALFANINSVCGSTVKLVEVPTSGGLDNLNALSTNKADIGFAQIDTIVTMRSGDENIAALQQVAALNNNYLHVFVATNGVITKGAHVWDKDTITYIRQFSQLKGKRVALVGSAQLMVQKLDKQLGYGMQFQYVTGDNADMDAINLVKTGKVDAMMSVSSWPAGVFDKLTPANGVTMINFDVPSAAPFIVNGIRYSNIGVYNAQTLASRNILVSRPFAGSKSKSVKALKECIAANLQEFREGEYEPAWNEVKNIDKDFGVTPFK